MVAIWYTNRKQSSRTERAQYRTENIFQLMTQSKAYSKVEYIKVYTREEKSNMRARTENKAINLTK